MTTKKREFDARVLEEAKRQMRVNKGDIDNILLEKHKKDEYTRQVINCSKHLSVGSGVRLAQAKQLKERLWTMESEVDRAKTNIRLYRQRRWGEKSMKRKDVEFMQTLFPGRWQRESTRGEVSTARDLRNSEEVLEIAKLA